MEFVEMFYTCMIPKYFDFNQEKRVNRNISVENMRMEDVFYSSILNKLIL